MGSGCVQTPEPGVRVSEAGPICLSQQNFVSSGHWLAQAMLVRDSTAKALEVQGLIRHEQCYGNPARLGGALGGGVLMGAWR